MRSYAQTYTHCSLLLIIYVYGMMDALKRRREKGSKDKWEMFDTVLYLSRRYELVERKLNDHGVVEEYYEYTLTKDGERPPYRQHEFEDEEKAKDDINETKDTQEHASNNDKPDHYPAMLIHVEDTKINSNLGESQTEEKEASSINSKFNIVSPLKAIGGTQEEFDISAANKKLPANEKVTLPKIGDESLGKSPFMSKLAPVKKVKDTLQLSNPYNARKIPKNKKRPSVNYCSFKIANANCHCFSAMYPSVCNICRGPVELEDCIRNYRYGCWVHTVCFLQSERTVSSQGLPQNSNSTCNESNKKTKLNVKDHHDDDLNKK